MIRIGRWCAMLCMAGGMTTMAHARDLPLWEAGLGVAAIHLPDYRGSDESHAYVLPLPYFVYRGERLKADRNGLRGVLLDTDRVNLDLSLSASIPVDSERNRARAGMPDLKPTIEIGPIASITLLRSANERVKLDLRVPVRAAFTVERSPRDVGVVISPHLNVDIRDVGAPVGQRGWNLGLLAGPIYATERQHDYFYGVPAAFATATRPAYSASGGYSGAQFIAALTRRFPRFWVGGYVRHDRLDGAAFESSPLVRTRGYTTAGIGIAWMLGESERRVAADD
ncbi:MAG TPA: MipA/OmpV family protein [Burkholderiaceae bacterium]|nr:MipA/OmpV family protein [Burkholderiaceae bacterium]